MLALFLYYFIRLSIALSSTLKIAKRVSVYKGVRIEGRINWFRIGANHDSSIWYEALRCSVSERTQSILIGLNSHSINSRCLFISNTIPINCYWIYIQLKVYWETAEVNRLLFEMAREWVCAAPHWVNNCIQWKFNLIIPSMSLFTLAVCFLSLILQLISEPIIVFITIQVSFDFFLHFLNIVSTEYLRNHSRPKQWNSFSEYWCVN